MLPKTTIYRALLRPLRLLPLLALPRVSKAPLLSIMVLKALLASLTRCVDNHPPPRVYPKDNRLRLSISARRAVDTADGQNKVTQPYCLLDVIGLSDTKVYFEEVISVCLAPMYGRWDPDTGKYKIIPERWLGEPKYHPRDIMIPCGGCVECRLAKSREWADRMMLELDHSKTAIFVTLTYSPEHIPLSMYDDNDEPIYTLDKRDVQLFLKRLRKRFEPRELRFYLSGEYGDSSHRPHYHAIIYGLSLADFPDCLSISRNVHGQMIYYSLLFTSIWGKGHCSIAQVSWQTCAYVARYTMKKLTGDMADIYALRQQVPPFALMSRRPGIAGYYPIEHPDCFDKSYLYVRDDYGVSPRTKMRVPSYIFDKLSLTNPELYAKIKSERRISAKLSMDNQLADTDLGFVEYLESKADEFDLRARKLPRDKV